MPRGRKYRTDVEINKQWLICIKINNVKKYLSKKIKYASRRLFLRKFWILVYQLQLLLWWWIIYYIKYKVDEHYSFHYWYTRSDDNEIYSWIISTERKWNLLSIKQDVAIGSVSLQSCKKGEFSLLLSGFIGNNYEYYHQKFKVSSIILSTSYLISFILCW